MDLMVAARVLYDRWTQAHKGRDAAGQPLPCWEALSGAERATWTAVAETAYHHVRAILDEHKALSKPVSGAALTDAAREPGYAPPSRDGVGSVEVKVGEPKAAPRPVCTCKLHDDAGRPRPHKRSCPRWTRADSDWCLEQWSDVTHGCGKPRDLPENPAPTRGEIEGALLRLRAALRYRGGPFTPNIEAEVDRLLDLGDLVWANRAAAPVKEG